VRRPWQGRATVAVVLVLTVLAGACSGGTTGASGNPGAVPGPALPVADGTLARYAGYVSPVYADPAAWVCRPGAARNACAGTPLDATAIAADGTLTPEPWPAPADPPVDCFYVYPTVSTDPGLRSDLAWSDDAEGAAVFSQAGRLQDRCRVYAPAYRQLTVNGIQALLAGRTDGVEATLSESGTDVLDAFRHYMANDNHGRPIVLFGHSQGAMALIGVLRGEFDPNPDVRAKLVTAILPGGNLLVPDGADVGGDLTTIPLCRQADQTACAVAWSSFGAGAPPGPGALFGRTLTPGRRVACVSPAALGGGDAPLHPYFPTTPSALVAAITGTGAAHDWVDPAFGRVTTTFVTTPGLVTGGCVSADGASYLRITVHADPADPRIDDLGGEMGPLWGLHLNDVQLVLGDVATLVGRQSEAYRRTVR
jgi:hypothetical protein